jgi:hypothetical protein
MDLQDYGMDSIMGRRLVRALEQTFGISVTNRDLLEHRSVAAVAELLAERARVGNEDANAPDGNPTPDGAGIDAGIVHEHSGVVDATSEYLDQFRKGLLGLDDVRKLIIRGDFL